MSEKRIVQVSFDWCDLDTLGGFMINHPECAATVTKGPQWPWVSFRGPLGAMCELIHDYHDGDLEMFGNDVQSMVEEMTILAIPPYETKKGGDVQCADNTTSN